jgi:hypothetical protein
MRASGKRGIDGTNQFVLLKALSVTVFRMLGIMVKPIGFGLESR